MQKPAISRDGPLSSSNKKDGYRQQNVRQRQKLISIIEILNVKEWPDLEIWVCGPSRSLKNARFASYLTLNNIVTLKTDLEVSQGN